MKTEAGIDEATLEALVVEFAANVSAMRTTLHDAIEYAQPASMRSRS